jgi:hypothetical protein
VSHLTAHPDEYTAACKNVLAPTALPSTHDSEQYASRIAQLSRAGETKQVLVAGLVSEAQKRAPVFVLIMAFYFYFKIKY